MALVIIHELGHFWAAKKSGVKVLEFGIGIPPKLFTYHTDKSGTEYTINLIPLGWFVRLKGEDPADEGTFNAPDSFIMAWFWKKVIILIGGVFMNFLTAYVLFAFWFFYGSKPITVLPSNAVIDQVETKYITTFDQLIKNNQISWDISEQVVSIQELVAGGLGEKAGLQAGSSITKINNEATNTLIINKQLKALAGKTFPITYQTSGSSAANTQQITCPEDQCMLGILMDTKNNLEIKPYKYDLPQSLEYARKEIIWQSKLSINALGRLFGSLLSFNKTKIDAQTNNLTGPVGAIKIGELIYQAGGRMQFLIFGAMISLSLAVFNILPIPALDGGRLLGVIIQKIFGLRPAKYFTIEGYINVIMFWLLMGLGIFILFKDLSRMRGLF
jgi:regulator of sigma E protease